MGRHRRSVWSDLENFSSSLFADVEVPVRADLHAVGAGDVERDVKPVNKVRREPTDAPIVKSAHIKPTVLVKADPSRASQLDFKSALQAKVTEPVGIDRIVEKCGHIQDVPTNGNVVRAWGVLSKSGYKCATRSPFVQPVSLKIRRVDETIGVLHDPCLAAAGPVTKQVLGPLPKRS